MSVHSTWDFYKVDNDHYECPHCYKRVLVLKFRTGLEYRHTQPHLMCEGCKFSARLDFNAQTQYRNWLDD